MAEEPVVTERLETRLERIEGRLERLAEGQNALSERMARMEGGFEQMSARLSELASQQRWGFGLYAVLILAVLGLYFKGSL